MELQPHEHLDEEGNIVGPGYEISADGDLLFYVSPRAMGYRRDDQIADEQRKNGTKPPRPHWTVRLFRAIRSQ